MSLVTSVKKVVRDRLIARAGGIDLSRLDKVPDAVSWPLRRDLMAPSARLQAARDDDPVQRLASLLGLEIWLVTGDAEAREVLSDTTSYSTDVRPYMGKSGSTTDGDIGGLGFTDPPDHTRLRRLLTPEFTMRRLQRLRPGIQAIVDRQIAEIEAAGERSETVDLVPTFAFPIPFLVICDVLGLPDEKRETFSKLATARFDVSLGGPGTIGAIGGSREFLLAEAARQRTNPGPGLIGQLIREHGDEISDFELGGLADGVFTGGLETSASMIALGCAVLLEDRDLWQRLVSQPDQVGAIVDELLRLLAVVQVAFPRFAKEDVVVGGKQITKGSVVVCSLPAANRDPRVGRGDDVDLANASGSHLAFGHGFHRCIGAELARMELKLAFPALARRYPGMQLAVPAKDLDYRALSIVYGVNEVPVRLGDTPGLEA
jgi:cytochrome P450